MKFGSACSSGTFSHRSRGAGSYGHVPAAGPPSSVHKWACGHQREDRCAPQTGFGSAVAQRQL